MSQPQLCQYLFSKNRKSFAGKSTAKYDDHLPHQ